MRNLYAITKKYLLIESQAAPHRSLISVLYEEYQTKNQSLNYVALMPTESSFVKMLYKVGFAKVYRPCYLPEHPDFRGSLTRKKIRTILIASKIDKVEPKHEWGAGTFCFIPEPKLAKLTPRNWDTNLGKLIRVVKEPVTTALRLLSWLIKFLPPSFIVRACGYMSRPVAVRLWPGWYVGSGHSSLRASTIIREALWTGFSDKCLNQTFTLPWHDGIKILAYPKIMTCRSLFVTGYYEPNEFYLLKKILKPGMTFIDIGANIGLYTLFASKLLDNNGIVLAIEPSERDMERLRANVELNNGQVIRLRQTAISNSSGERELLIAEEEHSGQNTFGAFAYAEVQNQCKRLVKTETLDEVIRDEALTRVDVIKIDVEGHEAFVFEGAKETLSNFRPILLVEISDTALMHQGCTSSRILSFLHKMGYRIYIFSKQTGLPVPLDNRIEIIDSENILAIHSSSEVSINGVA
jgi:FkbM family methyltransferase